MRFGLAPCQWDGLYTASITQILLAEKLGFDSVWMLEHHGREQGYFPSPLIALAGWATRTLRVKLGTGVLILPLYDPVHVAEDAALLDVMSQGRLILGVGLGYRREEFEAFRVPMKERGLRLGEGIEVIHQLWTEDSVTYGGKHFRLSNVSTAPKPLQKPHPPIWVGGWSKPALIRAARLGDAWLRGPVGALQDLKAGSRIYWEALRAFRKDPSQVDAPLMRDIYVAEDDERAVAEAGRHLWRMYAEDYFKWGHPLVREPQDFNRLREERFIIGSPAHCIEEVARYRKELGITDLLCRMHFPGLSQRHVVKAIKLFAEWVIPYFKGK